MDEGYVSCSDGSDEGIDFEIISSHRRAPSVSPSDYSTAVSVTPPPDLGAVHMNRVRPEDRVLNMYVDAPGGVSMRFTTPISKRLAEEPAVLRAQFARWQRHVGKGLEELHKRYAW